MVFDRRHTLRYRPGAVLYGFGSDQCFVAIENRRIPDKPCGPGPRGRARAAAAAPARRRRARAALGDACVSMSAEKGGTGRSLPLVYTYGRSVGVITRVLWRLGTLLRVKALLLLSELLLAIRVLALAGVGTEVSVAGDCRRRPRNRCSRESLWPRLQGLWELSTKCLDRLRTQLVPDPRLFDIRHIPV